MTRAEAVKYLKAMKDECNDTCHKVRYVTHEGALDMAIQALTQEPCDDAISRQAVLDGLKGCMCEDWVKTLFATMVKQLPSVTQKSGKWIVHPKGIYAHLVCDKCLSSAPYDCRTNYCPNCGAKMESEE